MSEAKKLRERVGNEPYSNKMAIRDAEMHRFLVGFDSGSGNYAFEQIAHMTDEELLARWARFMIEWGLE